MPDYRQHNVHAEVVQPEPAKPRSEVRQRTALVALRFLPDERAAVERAADDLGVSLSSLIRTSTLAEIGYEIREPEPAELTDGDGVDPQATDDLRNQAAVIRAAADAALSVVAPLLAAKDDTELWERDLKAARAEVTFWQGQVTEAHQAEDRLMQEHNTVCALAVNLRNDIVRLVTAALGTWDDEANSDEQIAEAERRIGELAGERDELITKLSEETAWQKDTYGDGTDKVAIGRLIGMEDALRVAREVFRWSEPGRPAAQEAPNPFLRPGDPQPQPCRKECPSDPSDGEYCDLWPSCTSELVSGEPSGGDGHG